MQAPARVHLEVVRLLCLAGADKDKAKRDGDAALMQASYNGHLEVVRMLWAAGADKDKASRCDNTALMRASVGFITIHVISCHCCYVYKCMLHYSLWSLVISVL